MDRHGCDAWVYDCEVFAHDWLFTFKRAGEGSYEEFWNDAAGVAEFVEGHQDSLFFSYNGSRYDQWILSAVLGGLSPEEVKSVNDWIISDSGMPWEHPLMGGVRRPDFSDVDLMKDTLIGTSLKSIEAHLGMDVEESSVPFDIDRPLTAEERREVEAYCRHDVDATDRLLDLREGYLSTKASLGERCGLPVDVSLAMTNAKLTAAVLGASFTERSDERDYVVPGNLMVELVPDGALEFFGAMHDPSVTDEELWSRRMQLEVGGCPVTLGFGGIHGAVPKSTASTGGGRTVVNADVASYYPSLMVRNGYCSRSMPTHEVFRGIYEERLAAKRSGDKATANALKLVVNTTYGATLNRYNDLYDPLMARSVCVSGQLYLLELASGLASEVEGLRIVQLNTDGIMYDVPTWRADDARAVCSEWESRTGFALEYDEVDLIRQKDVNNYAMRLSDGTEKVKGAWLVRGVSKAGAFSVNNDATIVAEALRRLLLDGTPVEDTVRGCDDPACFQMVAKASGKYSRVYQVTPDGNVDVQRCNRVFAAAEGYGAGRLVKVKKSDGSEARIAGLPERLMVSNRGMPPLEAIDKDWYADLARRRALEFEEDPMEEVKKEPARRAGKQEKVDWSTRNVYQKLAAARRMFIDSGARKSGKNLHLEFEYWELDDIVPAQTRIFDEVGLLEVFQWERGAERVVRQALDGDGQALDMAFERDGDVATATVVNVDNPTETIAFSLPWTKLPEIRNKDGRLASNPVQQMGSVQTYLRRYLKMQVMDICEADEVDASEPPKRQAPSAQAAPEAKVTVAAKPAPRPKAKPATAAQRKQAAEKVVSADGPAEQLQVVQLKKGLKKLKDGYGKEHPEVQRFIADLGAKTNNLADITKSQCEEALRAMGEMRESFETGKGE